MNKEKCSYARAMKLDYTMGCISIGMIIGFCIGYFFPRIF